MQRKKTGRSIYFFRRVLIAAIVLLAAAIAALLLRRGLQKRMYPLEYTGLVEACSQEYALDPYLVMAVIHTESSFRADAVSSSGARGLMQIMPETGSWIAGKLAVEGYEEIRLFEPELNAEFGCWYLRFLLNRYDGAVPLALAAYNAGQGRVDQWLQDPAVASGTELYNIPLEETANYGNKVQRAYEAYKKYYPDAFA